LEFILTTKGILLRLKVITGEKVVVTFFLVSTFFDTSNAFFYQIGIVESFLIQYADKLIFYIFIIFIYLP